jgi:hypothetical protein
MGLTRDTVRKGKKELLNNLADVPEDRVRKPGAGRPPHEKKVPIGKILFVEQLFRLDLSNLSERGTGNEHPATNKRRNDAMRHNFSP